jgi:hypothetical protein
MSDYYGKERRKMKGINASRNTDIKTPFFRGRPSALQKIYYKFLCINWREVLPNTNYKFKKQNETKGF